jgi:hypothetical protein
VSVAIRLAWSNPAGCIASDKSFRVVFFVVLSRAGVRVLQVGLIAHEFEFGLTCSTGAAAV